jgi:hypothetical protein
VHRALIFIRVHGSVVFRSGLHANVQLILLSAWWESFVVWEDAKRQLRERLL